MYINNIAIYIKKINYGKKSHYFAHTVAKKK